MAIPPGAVRGALEREWTTPPSGRQSSIRLSLQAPDVPWRTSNVAIGLQFARLPGLTHLREFLTLISISSRYVNVLTRLRGYKRATGLVLAAVTMLGAGSATLHSHPGGGAAEQLGLLSHVPISVIADPDARSAAFHLHSGSTVPNEPCVACVLSNAGGHVPLAIAPTPTASCVHIALIAVPVPAAPPLICADSRSPPTVA